MLERVRPNWRGQDLGRDPAAVEPIDLPLGLLVERGRRRGEDRPVRDARGRRSSTSCEPFRWSVPFFVRSSARSRPGRPGRSAPSDGRGGRSRPAPRRSVVGTESPDRPDRGGSSTNRVRLDSRNPTLVRPSMTNRRATNPCRRHRVTVRVDTLKRRLTASTVRTGSAACSTVLPHGRRQVLHEDAKVVPDVTAVEHQVGRRLGANPVIRIAEILIRISLLRRRSPPAASRPGRSVRAAAPVGANRACCSFSCFSAGWR